MQLALRAFQLHFRPSDWSGQPDAETAAIVFALLEKYRPRSLEALIKTPLYRRQPTEGQHTGQIRPDDAPSGRVPRCRLRHSAIGSTFTRPPFCDSPGAFEEDIAGSYGRAYDRGTRGDWCNSSLVLPSTVELTTEDMTDTEEELAADHPLVLYDDNGNGRISCAEARNHSIAPVCSTHPAYPYMTDADGDGVVCEQRVFQPTPRMGHRLRKKSFSSRPDAPKWSWHRN